MNIRLLVPMVLTVSACGGPSGLSPDSVRSIPDGDGVGTARSGTYSVEIRTLECDGSCGPFTLGIFSASVCDVGEVSSETLTVVHRDGHLRIDTSELPSRFEGGTSQDGSFDVGGYATQFGGELEITARATGRIDDTGELVGTVRSWTWGNVEGQGADCRGVHEIRGARD